MVLRLPLRSTSYDEVAPQGGIAVPPNAKTSLLAPMPTALFYSSAATADCNASNPEVKLIASNADWGAVNNLHYRIFCVLPGDYSGAGIIVLRTSGAPGEERYLRYYSPAGAVGHPAQQTGAQQATLRGLMLNGASHWVIDGLRLAGMRRPNALIHGAAYNVLTRMLIEQGASHLLLLSGGSDNTVQNSVIRTTAVVPNEDRHCIVIQGSERVKLLGNEIYDCAGDAIHQAPPRAR